MYVIVSVFASKLLKYFTRIFIVLIFIFRIPMKSAQNKASEQICLIFSLLLSWLSFSTGSCIVVDLNLLNYNYNSF